jgi:hypothetical protein
MKSISMRNKILTVIILTLVIFGSTANAQIHVGATTAYNATFVLDEGLSKDPRYNSTYTYQFAPVGFSFGADFGRKFGLSLEAILSNQGQIYDMIDKAKEIAGQRKIDLQYLNLPLLMKFMGGGSGKVRGNFNLGPQLSILTAAVESLQGTGTFDIPAGIDFQNIQSQYGQYADQIVNNNDGTYTVPDNIPVVDVLTKEANDFKNTEFQLAAAFGLDIDLSRHLYLTTQVRANYGLVDMRNGDVIDAIKAGGFDSIKGARANFLVGVQIGIHYYFGILRSYK